MRIITNAPQWLRPCCEQICSALKARSRWAVVFVGDASLSPGVQHVDAYATLAPQFQAMFSELGVPLVNEAPGVDLEADGLHWRVTSRPAVERIIDTLVQRAASTETFQNCKPPMLWDWRYNPSLERHYPRASRATESSSITSSQGYIRRIRVALNSASISLVGRSIAPWVSNFALEGPATAQLTQRQLFLRITHVQRSRSLPPNGAGTSHL